MRAGPASPEWCMGEHEAPAKARPMPGRCGLLAATRRSRSLPPWDINESFPLWLSVSGACTHTNDSYLELYDTLLERDSAAKSTMW